MKRNRKMLEAAYYEAGRDLLIRKFLRSFKDFERDPWGDIKRKNVFPSPIRILRPNPIATAWLCNQSDDENTIIGILNGRIRISIAGLLAKQIGCNSSDDSLHDINYGFAYHTAIQLSDRYEANRIHKSPNQIIQENEKEVILYLTKNKPLLNQLARMFYQQTNKHW